MRRREPNDFQVLEVDMGYVTPCHIPLTGRGEPMFRDQDGYSAMLLDGGNGKRRWFRAHRVRYEAVHGAIEPGLVPDQLCKHRPCCNPAHMEAVTIAENNRRGFRTKLSAEDVVHIRAMASAGVPQHQIGRKFGISQSHVSNVARGQYWADGLSPAWERVKLRRTEG
jgi:hypothetical protein